MKVFQAAELEHYEHCADCGCKLDGDERDVINRNYYCRKCWEKGQNVIFEPVGK